MSKIQKRFENIKNADPKSCNDRLPLFFYAQSYWVGLLCPPQVSVSSYLHHVKVHHFVSVCKGVGKSALLKIEPMGFMWTAESSPCILLVSYMFFQFAMGYIRWCNARHRTFLITLANQTPDDFQATHCHERHFSIQLQSAYTKEGKLSGKNTNKKILFCISINHEEFLTPKNRPVVWAPGPTMSNVSTTLMVKKGCSLLQTNTGPVLNKPTLT